MYFHKRLFVSDKIENKEEIKQLLQENIPVLNLYLICVSNKNNNMFEILSSREYFKGINIENDYIVIGLAMGKKDSFNLIQEIFKWWLEGRENVDGLKKYFING